MPSNPASFASRRHCSSVIFSGYGNPQRLIDFLNGYFFRGTAFGWLASADAPSMAADAANISRRSGYGPDMRGSVGREEYVTMTRSSHKASQKGTEFNSRV